MKLTVLGAGAWGSALAMHLAIKYPVTLWARNNGHISGMAKARSNPLYLGDFKFPEQLVLESNLEKAVKGSDLVISVVPTSGFRTILRSLKEIIRTPIIWANKGLEMDSSK